MSVENPENAASNQAEIKPQNGEQDQRFNGMSNGHIGNSSSSSHHKHKSSKDKHRDKDRDHKSSKSSSSGRDKESDKNKSSSSSSKDNHKNKERSDKDKERHGDKDKDKHYKDRDKHKSSSSSHSHGHHKTSSRDKEKSDKDKERTKDKDKDRSEHGKEKDKERDKNREKDKEKEKHRDKDKDKMRDKISSNDADKERDRKKEHKSNSHHRSKDRERSDKDKDKDRHHKSSSSLKDKHSNSSSTKSKDRHHTSSSSSKDKDRHRGKEKERKEKNEIVGYKDCVDNKTNTKVKVEEPRNDYDQSCSGFPMKEENLQNKDVKYDLKAPNQFKEEVSMNYSQASSCDYSMSQFREDEPAFVVKEEMPDESQDVVDESGLQIKSEPEDEIREDDDEEDIPLAKRKIQQIDVESEDDVPLVSRKKMKTEKKEKKDKKAKKKKREEIDDELMDEKPKKKKLKKEKSEPVAVRPQHPSPAKGRKKKDEEPDEVWKWWEEEKRDDNVKWTYLEHKGPVFAPSYEPLPDNVKFFYDGRTIKLSTDAEEIASFYAKMLTHDYVTKKQFNDNFFKDWRKSMTSKERELIKDLSKCNFKEMHDYFQAQSEKRKQMSKEEKLAIKEENENLIKEYGYCIIDGHKQRIGNFKLEPPGLFRGRGEHPKMGLVKRRLMPEDILINCSKDSKIPEPPKGHKWKEVRHDNTVTWLASWTENVQGQVKYIMLNPSSKLKGEKDFQKYEVARRLDKHIDKIRQTYHEEWKSKEMRIRQRGVALYFIDKLALRAGNEKDEDQADTVGCCSLRVEHVKLFRTLNGKENVVVFDFLGKDSIRYYNEVEVEKRVFKNLELFMENKKEGDDLFDRLNTMVLNEHLRELMEGLTAKVFRTYNASITLQQQLDLLTDSDSSVPEKLLSYNRANRAVAILCNHQRSIPKSHEKSMENLKEKIRQKTEQLEEAEAELRDLQKLAKRGSVKEKLNADKKKKQVEKLREQLKKLELQQTDRDENKTIALGTSKLNYLDPRISVAWCKRNGVPIEKIFNKTQREKFRWAIDMADENYRF